MKVKKFEKNGIVLLNKEKGVSSFGAINRLKWLIKANKVGHAGTLDPMAEGLLIVMLNNATKFSDDLMKKDKEYYVELEMGYETDTYDTEGEITEKGNVNVSQDEIESVINSFVGEIEQTPPMYSAIKINGEKLYDLARKGIEVERKARKIRINYIKDIKIDFSENKVSFYTSVSSGTYIRSLVRDIGQKLGTFATMTKLVRTQIDKYYLKNAVTLSEIEKLLEQENVEENRDFVKRQKIEMKKDESIEEKIYGILENIFDKESNVKRELKIQDIIKFKDIEEILEYKEIVISNDKYLKLKNGMTVLVGFRKLENIKGYRENTILKVFVTNGKTQKREFKGVVKIIKIGYDKVYLKRDKYFL